MVVEELLRELSWLDGGELREVQAVTPHGSYVFSIADVTGAVEDDVVMLHLEEIA